MSGTSFGNNSSRWCGNRREVYGRIAAMLYSESEAAALLGISRLTLKRERKRGSIEYTLLGMRGIRYTQAQLDEYLARGRRRNAPAATPATVATPAPRITRQRDNGLAQALAILNRK